MRFLSPPSPPSLPLPLSHSPFLQLQKLGYEIDDLDFFGDQKMMWGAMKDCKGFVDKFLDADPSMGCGGLADTFFGWLEERLVCEN